MQDSEVSLANTAQATMKLRFKGEDCALGGTSKSFSLQVDDNCDWCQLQEAISRQCPNLERFSLSLNKRDSLQANGADKVKDLGICSGDLLWIQVESASQPAESCQAPAIAAQTPHSKIQKTEAQSSILEDKALASRLGPCSSMDAPGCLASAVHQAILEGGLQHLQEGQAADPLGHQQAYALASAPADSCGASGRAVCKMRYIMLGSSLVVWAAAASMGVRSVTLTPDAAVTPGPQCTRPSVLLSRAASLRIHDELLLPVRQALCQEQGLSLPASLRTLPLEIIMPVLQSLQAKELALLGCTCKEFSRLAGTEELWESLFKKEFMAVQPRPQDVSRVGWKGLFAAAWTDRRERRRRRQYPPMPLGRFPWPGGAGPFGPPSPALPGIAGGDIDRLPQPFLGIPRPFGRTSFGGRHFQILLFV